MNRLRHRLRLLLAEMTSPSEILQRLDTDMGGQLGSDFATVVVAMIDEHGRLTVATAGHPPPLVLQPGVPPRYVEAVPGPPVGVRHGACRASSELDVAPGSTVVFFTDGLVERRGESIQQGLARLRETCAGLDHRSVDVLADAVLEALLPDGQRDDVALAVVRLRGVGEAGVGAIGR